MPGLECEGGDFVVGGVFGDVKVDGLSVLEDGSADGVPFFLGGEFRVGVHGAEV